MSNTLQWITLQSWYETPLFIGGTASLNTSMTPQYPLLLLHRPMHDWWYAWICVVFDNYDGLDKMWITFPAAWFSLVLNDQMLTNLFIWSSSNEQYTQGMCTYALIDRSPLLWSWDNNNTINNINKIIMKFLQMVKCNEFSDIDDDDGGVKDHEYSKE